MSTVRETLSIKAYGAVARSPGVIESLNVYGTGRSAGLVSMVAEADQVSVVPRFSRLEQTLEKLVSGLPHAEALDRVRDELSWFLEPLSRQPVADSGTGVQIVVLISSEDGAHLVGGQLGDGSTWVLTADGRTERQTRPAHLQRSTVWRRSANQGDRLVMLDADANAVAGVPDHLLRRVVDDARGGSAEAAAHLLAESMSRVWSSMGSAVVVDVVVEV